MARRENRINLFVNDEELARLQRRADMLGIDVPAVIRMALRATDPDPEVRRSFMDATVAAQIEEIRRRVGEEPESEPESELT